MPLRVGRRAVVVIGLTVLGASCKPSDVLSVPPPATTIGFTSATDLRSAEILYNGAKVEMFTGVADYSINGLLNYTERLSDEFTASDVLEGGFAVDIDARYTAYPEAPQLQGEEGDYALRVLYPARWSLLLAVPILRQFEPPTGQWKVGEAFALAGYDELLIGESYCAGATFSTALPAGGFIYGAALTTDSIFGQAAAHFDSALASAHGNDTITALANVGLARARLDRGQFATAAAGVSGVPIGFVYNVQLAPTIGNNAGDVNLYAAGLPSAGVRSNACGEMNVADREGTNGLPFVSAHDPRLVLDSTLAPTCDGLQSGISPGTWYYPSKFGDPVSTGLLPLATGVEARLIGAEAALHAGDVATWSSDLNALRAAGPSTYLQLTSGMPALAPDSTTGASAIEQVDVMFRERAFWLFGTGTRLGDLRRLIRQYNRNERAVFPVGPYPLGNASALPQPLPSYGTDVNLSLPTSQSGTTETNPNYKGCLTSTKTA